MRRRLSLVLFAFLAATAPASAFNATSIKAPVTTVSASEEPTAAEVAAFAAAGGSSVSVTSGRPDVLVGATGDDVSYECRMRGDGVVCVFADAEGYRVCVDRTTCMRTTDPVTALAFYRPEVNPGR